MSAMSGRYSKLAKRTTPANPMTLACLRYSAHAKGELLCHGRETREPNTQVNATRCRSAAFPRSGTSGSMVCTGRVKGARMSWAVMLGLAPGLHQAANPGQMGGM